MSTCINCPQWNDDKWNGNGESKGMYPFPSINESTRNDNHCTPCSSIAHVRWRTLVHLVDHCRRGCDLCGDRRRSIDHLLGQVLVQLDVYLHNTGYHIFWDVANIRHWRIWARMIIIVDRMAIIIKHRPISSTRRYITTVMVMVTVMVTVTVMVKDTIRTTRQWRTMPQLSSSIIYQWE